jgi:hypothetical protein
VLLHALFDAALVGRDPLVANDGDFQLFIRGNHFHSDSPKFIIVIFQLESREFSALDEKI